MGKQSQAPQQYGGQGQGPQMPQGQKVGDLGGALDSLHLPGMRPGGFQTPLEAFGLQAPTSPDFYGAATQTGMASRPNIDTPFGSQQWTVGPDGQWHLSAGLTGPLAGAAEGLSNQAAASLSSPLDLSSLGAVPDPTQARQQAQDAAYKQATSRLDPMFDKREDALRTRLINQGLDPNSEAARNATTQEGETRNDAYSSALNAAVQQGNEAGQQFFNQGMAARQQKLAELLRQRGGPLSEMAQLLGLTQTPTTGQGPDYLGAAGMQGQYNMNAFDTQNKNRADTAKGGFDLAGELAKLLMGA